MERRPEGEFHTVYDDDRAVVQLDGQGRLLARRTFGPAVEEVLAEAAAGTRRFFLRNSIQSITGISDERGTPVARVTYKAFGAPTTPAELVSPFSLTGRPYERDTGLVSFRFRDYDPALGRFLQPDPLQLLLAWQSPYVYAGNNPISAVDLYGLLGWKDIGKGLAGVVGVAVGAVALPWLAAGAAATATAAVAGATAASTAWWVTGGIVAAGAGVSMVVNAVQSAGSNDDGATTLIKTGIGALTGGGSAAIGALAAAGALPAALAGTTGVVVTAIGGAVLGAANSWLTGGVSTAGAATGFGGWLAGLGATGGNAAAVVAGALVTIAGGMWEAMGQAVAERGTAVAGRNRWDPAADPPVPVPVPTACPVPGPSPSP